MEPKQVIVMRTDLNMRKGKMIAQGAHASMVFLVSNLHGVPLTPIEEEWLNGLFTKICVRVDSEEELLGIRDLAAEHGVRCSLIKDAGLTEFGGVPTYTCLALGPDYPERIDPVTGHLKLL